MYYLWVYQINLTQTGISYWNLSELLWDKHTRVRRKMHTPYPMHKILRANWHLSIARRRKIWTHRTLERIRQRGSVSYLQNRKFSLVWTDRGNSTPAPELRRRLARRTKMDSAVGEGLWVVRRKRNRVRGEDDQGVGAGDGRYEAGPFQFWDGGPTHGRVQPGPVSWAGLAKHGPERPGRAVSVRSCVRVRLPHV
jgi:hypothetical protein